MKILTRNSVYSSLLALATHLHGQSVPDSVRVQRLQANRSQFSQWDGGESLRQQAIDRDSDITLTPVVFENLMSDSAHPHYDPDNRSSIVSAAVDSDLIVIGTGIKNLSEFTEHESFLFTDSEIVVERVIPNGASHQYSDQVHPGQEITVASAGGEVHVNSHRIVASIPNVLAIESGRRYLLFLKYLPASESYYPADIVGFDLSGPTIVPLHTNRPVPFKGLLSKHDLFIRAVRTASLSARKRNVP